MAIEFPERHDHHPELTLAPTPEIWAAEEARSEPEDALGVETLGLAPHRYRAVAQALTQRGVRESGGTNAGLPLQRYVRYFIPGSGPQPWCAFFVSWCFDTTGDQNHRMPWSNPGLVESIHDWARRTSRMVDTPRHGDMFGVGGEHIGLVAGSNPVQGVIWTIEGNYGDAVAQRNISYRSAGLWFARM
jgi:hypothetical protein